MKKLVLAAMGFFLILSACQKSPMKSTMSLEQTQALRPLTENEKAEDFDQLLFLFKNYYGPYQFKERLLGLNIEKAHQEMKAKALLAKTDEEFAGYIMQFGALLRDGHVQIQVRNTSSGVIRYKVPIVVTPVEGKALVADITEEVKKFTGLSVGDEILTIDGKTPADLQKTAVKYRSSANDLTNSHFVLYSLYRPSYMTDLVPTKPTVTIKALTQKGDALHVELPWELEKYNKSLDSILKVSLPLDLSVGFAKDFNAVVPAHRMQMGQVNPFFLSSQVQEQFQLVKVESSLESRKKYELLDTENPPIYAALYKFGGKTLLLVRSATYAPEDFSNQAYMKAYMALLDQYDDLADVLVLDQTHNPGGSYCSAFYEIFGRDNDVQTVQQCRADRRWINDFALGRTIPEYAGATEEEFKHYEAMGRLIEKAYDAGQFLSEPIALFTGYTHVNKLAYRWTKPMLVLTDELAGSCGDIFPMLVKANKRAKIFGQATMGLGGNVEEVGVLTHSQIPVRMTRGLFSPYQEDGAYQVEDLIENNGVKPDYPYSHTVEDFRNGFVGYVKAFSEKAVEQLNGQ